MPWVSGCHSVLGTRTATQAETASKEALPGSEHSDAYKELSVASSTAGWLPLPPERVLSSPALSYSRGDRGTPSYTVGGLGFRPRRGGVPFASSPAKVTFPSNTAPGLPGAQKMFLHALTDLLNDTAP